MTTTTTLAMLAIATGGCSIIYNPDKIPTQSDAPIDTVIDANASMPVVMDIAPATIAEGTGDQGSRAEIVVIHGDNFVAGAQISITGTNAHIDVDNTKLQVSADSHYIAVPVTAHVDPNLGAGQTISLDVSLSQPVPGGSPAMAMMANAITLQGLDELKAPPVGNDWSLLEPLYSSIQLTGTFSVNSGAAKVREFRAIAGVTMGDLTALGGSASGTGAGGAGTAGCPGGAGNGPGGCDGGGKVGGNATQAGGGGGGGFATAGGGGGGGAPGAAGISEGDDMISSYVDIAQTRANHAAGGAGGAILLGIAGGGGGGGGGSIELTAGGDLVVGSIDVSGGNGAASGGAGGGGGAGGVILVRAGGTITTGTLKAAGGGGGSAAAAGGAGSAGRIRWEASTGTGPAGTMPAPLRGISFSGDTPLVVTTKHPIIKLVGTPNRSVNVYTVDSGGNQNSGPEDVSMDGSSTATMTPTVISPGFNRVCMTLTAGMHGAVEAERCIDIAYLP